MSLVHIYNIHNIYICTRGDQGSPIEGAWIVGWGGDVNIHCEDHMDVEATRYDAVQLSWKLMLRYSTVGYL